MSAEFTKLGYQAQADVDGTPMPMVSGNWRDTGDDVDVSDTESGAYKRQKVGLQQFDANLESNLQSDVAYYGPVFDLFPSIESGYVILDFAPHGRGEGAGFILFNIPSFKIIGTDGNFRVRGSEPQSLRFSGKSDGTYTRL